MTQRQARILFTRLKAELILWIPLEGKLRGEVWEVAEGESYVKDTDAADGDHDGPHKAGGTHYLGTGGDLALYVNGVYVKWGGSPQWRIIGQKWKTMHPDCAWGGDFQDDNHVSVRFAGRA